MTTSATSLSHPTIDLALARRLERAEATANAASVEARRALDPDSSAEWIEVAGAYAMFDAVGSPLTQTFGVGVFDPFLEPELDRVESFFRERGSATYHEVCALAAPETRALLEARGYGPVEESVVLVRPTERSAASLSPITVRVTDASEADLWARVAAEGWSSEGAELAAFVEQIGQVMARARGVRCFVAELDGRPIAAAALNMGTDVALMAGASTIPSARGRGAQQALLAARLDVAAREGRDLAMVVTQPGSGSMRNAERRGFRPAYGRIKWRLATGD